MIPKVIHYCWFGGNPLPPLAQKCIDSWKKYCPDYEIIEWNESNYDITKNNYMREAYEAKKWGFVPDYARKDIIYEYGGIYLDTDVEIVKSFDDLLSNKAFFGMEKPGQVALGLGFGAEKGNELIRELRDIYIGKSFKNEDGTLNLTPCTEYETPMLIERGLAKNNEHQVVCGVHIYPTEYFAPKDGYQADTVITENTHSIHYYNLSWATPYMKFRAKVYWRIKKIFGDGFAEKVRSIVGRKK